MDEHQRDLLIREYQIAHDGHKSRDELVPREFAFMLQSFFVFITLIGAAKAFQEFNRTFATLLVVCFGITALICLMTYLIDIEANTSCKRALRKRALEIEEMLDSDKLLYWRTLRDREMYWEEGLFKRFRGGSILPSIASGFVLAARLLVVLWVILVVLILAWGEAIKFG